MKIDRMCVSTVLPARRRTEVFPVLVCTPGGLDRFFREVSGGAALEETAARYGVTYG
jgi:hypothetical protein